MSKRVEGLQNYINEFLRNREPINVLEAGCGALSHIDFGPNSYITGIDISREQLEKNTILDEKILGDIQDYDLLKAHYDVIICWDVLEHLNKPQKAISNFMKAIKEDGVIVLALPNALSVKGIMTKFTPYWFHAWIYYKFFNAKSNENNSTPFKTYMRLSIAPKSLLKTANKCGFKIVYTKMYESSMQRQILKKSWILVASFKIIGVILKTISFKNIEYKNTDLIMVLKNTNILQSGK